MSYFVQRMGKFLQTKNKKLIGWDEILEGGIAEDANSLWRFVYAGVINNQPSVYGADGTTYTFAAFTPGSTHVIVKIKPGYEEIRQAKIAKKKPEDIPKDDILIFDLVHQTDTTTANVKSFAVAEKDRNLVVYLSEKTPLSVMKRNGTSSKNTSNKRGA